VKRLIGSVLLALALTAGCSRQAPVDRVTYVPDDDPKMAAAIEKARQTLPTFFAALNAPKATQKGFAVKVPFKDGDQEEHMWLSPVRYDGKKFHGTINNEPETVKTVKMGDAVSIEPAEISDWMFIDQGKLVGGHTIRALRDHMNAQERADFEKNFPFKLD
jgi:uncharacterized protein YegJ (DUF2314 family)